MKTLKHFILSAALGTVGAVWCASGADSMTPAGGDTTDTTYSPFYRAQELSLDLFGTGSLRQETIDHISGDRVGHNARLGAGAGLNYFFCRCFGIGGDAYTENTAHDFVDSTSGNLILRLPIGQTGLAPYVFGGGGYQFDEVAQKFGQAGGGLEFRFTPNVGVFVDARFVFADRTDDYGVGRAGLRLSF